MSRKNKKISKRPWLDTSLAQIGGKKRQREFAYSLADQLHGTDRLTLGTVDCALAAKALRYYAKHAA